MESDNDGDFKGTQQCLEMDNQNPFRICSEAYWNISHRRKRLDSIAFKPRRRTGRKLYARYWENSIYFTNETKQQNPDADSTSPLITETEFKKRDITTIPEEVMHYKRYSRSLSAFKEKKNHQEKVASLAVAVGRLREMCLAKPEVLQDSVPEEVMKLFSSIQI